jgi:hypothetical protein
MAVMLAFVVQREISELKNKSSSYLRISSIAAKGKVRDTLNEVWKV